MRHLVIILALGLLTACGGGSSPVAPTTNTGTTATTLTTSDGHTLATGLVDGSGAMQGPWTWYHDNGAIHLQASFVDGALDETAPWQLINPDGSIQADSSDGPYVFASFWEEALP